MNNGHPFNNGVIFGIADVAVLLVVILLGLVAAAFDWLLQRKIRNRLRESERRPRLILESITEGFFALSRDWRFTYTNPQAERILDRKPGDLIGKVLWDEYPDLGGSEFERAYYQTMNEQAAASFTSYYPGHNRWYEVNSYPSPDGIAVFFRNVTEQKQAEEEIARLVAASDRERRLFETVLANTADFNYTFDLEGRFTYVNNALLAIWQKARPDAVGKDFHDLGYPSDLADRLQRQIRQVIDVRRPVRDETPYTSAAGERQYEYIFMPVVGADGTVEAVAGSTRDITDRKKVEQQLRESEERFRLVAESIPQLAWAAHPDGNIYWYNSRWYEYTGTTLEQMAGWGWQSVHDPDMLPKVLRQWKASIATGEPFDMVFPLRRKDGVFRPFLTRVMPLINNEGRVVQWFGTNTDVTEQRELQEALKEADRRKDELLATLAHELRNPLAPIRNGLQLMRLSGGDAETFEKARGMMDRQLTHLVRLVDDLMDVSRITRGKIELRRARIQLAAAVHSAVETSRPLIKEMGHELTITTPKQSIVVDGDLTRLAQVFANLLNNAAKYSERGGHIWLTVDLASGGCEPPDRVAVVSVRDAGVGIAADQLPRVFDLFTQVDRSLDKSQGGLGIGLSLVKGLVEMHGGRIEAHSDGPGKGSEFIVRLPVVIEDAAPKVLGKSESAAAPKSSLRVLVVDDNRDGADSLAMLLRIMGNEVRAAYDGQQGVEAAGEFRPDVVLLDIGLPKLNGYEACRLIREQPEGKGAVLIAITGWGQDEDRRRSREAGFDHHLVKPVEPHSLMKLLAGLSAAKA